MAEAPIAEKRIFVVCPGGVVTGGPELLHQLVGTLVGRGRDASIVYSPLGKAFPTASEYGRYGCPVALAIPDEPDVAVIVPEVATHLLARFRHARQVIWWLSVDNYRGGISGIHPFITLVRRIVRGRIPVAATHLFQCAFARDYVAEQFGRGGVMLSDFLAQEYFENASEAPRRNVVAFNPKKGRAYTARLMRAHPQLEFLPLQGMPREQLRQALDTCKVYIDFGEHPGKDRLPREAAARGAVVIVGSRGSARNDEDLPLPRPYKIDERAMPIGEVGRVIQDCFDRYEWHAREQQAWRDAIRRERAVFEEQVDRVFS